MRTKLNLILRQVKITRRVKNTVSAIIATGFMMTSFQNCSQGFAPIDMVTGNFSSSTNGKFAEAKAILQAKCISCHNGATTTSFNLVSGNDFVRAGLVTAGSPSKSKLIYRLKGYATDMGAPRDMPQNQPAISAGELSVLSDWVTSIGAPITTNPFACSSGEAPDTLNAKRLTRVQVFNTYKALVVRGIGQAGWDWMNGNYLNVMQALPPDTSATYSTADTNFSALHGQAYFNVADQITQFVTQTNQNYITNFVKTYINYNPGACVFTDVNSVSSDCQDAFIKNFGLRAWGREVEVDNTNSNNELAALKQEFTLNAGSAGVNNVIFRMFVSPQFMFHLNTSIQPSGPYYRLSSYSIARRLSYIFTQAPPDETLLGIAATQDLLSDMGFASAMNYLNQNMSGIDQFAAEWLKTETLPNYKETSLPKFQLITKNFTPDENLRKAMKDEVVELVSYVTNSNQGLKELYTSNISFARDPNLLKVYGLSTAAPSPTTEANAVRFPAGERSGLLTRAAMLFAGGQTENPMHRGVSIRKNLFCKAMNPPPPDLVGALQAPPADPNATTRDRYTAATSSTSCMGCHSMINPVGFAFSKYNSFGGYQAQEPIFDTNNQLVKYLPTDARTNLLVALGIDKDTNDAIEFSDSIHTNADLKSCFTQNFYAYVNGAASLPGEQTSCSMNRMYQSLDSGASLKEAFSSAVSNPQFRYRKLVP